VRMEGETHLPLHASPIVIPGPYTCPGEPLHDVSSPRLATGDVYDLEHSVRPSNASGSHANRGIAASRERAASGQK